MDKLSAVCIKCPCCSNHQFKLSEEMLEAAGVLRRGVRIAQGKWEEPQSKNEGIIEPEKESNFEIRSHSSTPAASERIRVEI